MLALSLFLPAIFAIVARAQTQAQSQACQNTVEYSNYQTSYTWSTTDDSHYFNVTWTYNPSYCTSPVQIPVTKIQLVNVNDNTLLNCPLVQFDQSGVLYAQCPITLGAMARSAQEYENGIDDDYYVSLGVGKRPSVVNSDTYFDIQPFTPPTPSGGMSKRRVNKRHQCDIPGFNYCRTSSKTFGCIDTSSSLYSCGACPDSEDSVDCTAIDGADRVECRTSQCFVHSCLRGYQVSADRKSCVPVTNAALQPRRRRK